MDDSLFNKLSQSNMCLFDGFFYIITQLYALLINMYELLWIRGGDISTHLLKGIKTFKKFIAVKLLIVNNLDSRDTLN